MGKWAREPIEAIGAKEQGEKSSSRDQKEKGTNIVMRKAAKSTNKMIVS